MLLLMWSLNMPDRREGEVYSKPTPNQPLPTQPYVGIA